MLNINIHTNPNYLTLSRSVRSRSTASSICIYFCVCLIASYGCSASNRAEVQGTVTLDGQPLTQGTLAFFPTGDAKGPAAGGTIVGGKYFISADQGSTIGTNRVEIRSARATGKMLALRKEAEVVEVLPDRYHSQSVLTANIKQGKNTVDFELQSR